MTPGTPDERRARLAEIMMRYPAPESPEFLEEPGDRLAGRTPIERFAVVAKSLTCSDYVVSFVDNERKGLMILAQTADENWTPWALFDLALGRSLPLHTRLVVGIANNPDCYAKGNYNKIEPQADLGAVVA